MSKYLELCKKIKELADRGERGEQEEAKRALDRLMKKHGITIEQVNGDEIEEFRFRVKEADARFFKQILSSVLGGGVPYAYQQGFLYIDTTKSNFIEIETKFEFYKDRLKEHLEASYISFVQINELYQKQSEEEKKETKERELTETEKKALKLMESMNKENFNKQIQG